jgi:hypothetical protein
MIKFDKDKQLHAIVGAAIGVLGMKFLGPLAFITLVVAAVGKEAYDHFYPDKHTADMADLLVTIGAGAVAMYVTSMF